MKRSFFYASLLCALLMTTCRQSSEPTQAEATSSEEKEVVQYLTPKQKSIHLFDLPEGVSESQFMAGIAEMNAAIRDLGYSGVGYYVYKVESDTISKYRYFMEGLWPDPDTYRIIHESEKWQQARNNHSEMMGKVFATEIYRKVLKAD